MESPARLSSKFHKSGVSPLAHPANNTMIDWIKTVFSGECGFRIRNGIYCPGCGGTRALIALLEGDLIQSFRYNPLTFLVLMDVFLMTLFSIIERATKRKHLFVRLRLIYNIGLLLFIGVYFIFRNYLWVVQGIDLLGDMS